jgi:hypothetical protein
MRSKARAQRGACFGASLQDAEFRVGNPVAAPDISEATMLAADSTRRALRVIEVVRAVASLINT